MVDVLNLVTFGWLFGWTIWSLRCLSTFRINSVHFAILTHFAFCGIPILCDAVFGVPSYSFFPGFYLATNDITTSVIYDIYVILCPVIWYLHGISGFVLEGELFSNKDGRDYVTYSRRVEPLLYCIALSPVLLAIAAPDPWIYVVYGGILGQTDSSITTYHAVVQLASLISILACTVLLLGREKIDGAKFSLIISCLLVACWIHGKRNIIAVLLMLMSYVALRKGYLVKSRLYVFLIGVVLLMVLYSFMYQGLVRDLDFTTFEDSYDNLRADFGRDRSIKLAIYAELNPDEVKILENRGESVAFYLTMYIPRDIWADKPLTYATCFTSAALLESSYARGWGVTTSILDEAIANFGWLGMLIGPLFISTICRIGDKSRNVYIHLLTILVSILFLSVELAAFMPVFLLWLISVISSKRRSAVTRITYKEERGKEYELDYSRQG